MDGTAASGCATDAVARAAVSMGAASANPSTNIAPAGRDASTNPGPSRLPLPERSDTGRGSVGGLSPTGIPPGTIPIAGIPGIGNGLGPGRGRGIRTGGSGDSTGAWITPGVATTDPLRARVPRSEIGGTPLRSSICRWISRRAMAAVCAPGEVSTAMLAEFSGKGDMTPPAVRDRAEYAAVTTQIPRLDVAVNDSGGPLPPTSNCGNREVWSHGSEPLQEARWRVYGLAGPVLGEWFRKMGRTGQAGWSSHPSRLAWW